MIPLPAAELDITNMERHQGNRADEPEPNSDRRARGGSCSAAGRNEPPTIERGDRRAKRRRRPVVGGRAFGDRRVAAIPGWSLAEPGREHDGSLSVRVVEWARDHHLGAFVGFANAPGTRTINHRRAGHRRAASEGPPRRRGSGPAPQPTPVTIPRVKLANIVPLVTNALPSEGVWQRAGRLVDGHPAMWVAYLRPDAVHTSLLVGVARFDMSRLAAVLHAAPKSRWRRVDSRRAGFIH